MQTSDSQAGYVRYFADDAAGKASRSLQFLRVIEQTITALENDTKAYRLIADIGSTLADKVRNKESITNRIDPTGEVEAGLDSAMDSMCKILAGLERGRNAAATDKQLKSDDGVVDAYEALIEALKDAHAVLCELHWAVTEHDTELDEVSKETYKSVDDLFAALKI